MLILLVDGDVRGAGGLAEALALQPGIEVECVASGATALDRIAAQPFDAVVADLDVRPAGGTELVRRLRQRRPASPLIVMTSRPSVDRAVEAMRAGATDFLPRPIDPGVLAALLRRVVEGAPFSEQLHMKRGGAGVRAFDYLQGDHPRLDAIRAFAERVALVRDATVLVLGESGTGKGCLARAVHALSGSEGRFVEVACAALPAGAFELELAGQAETGAGNGGSPRRGLIETAAGGTLFLDEIASLPPDLQARLLVFLESRQVRRVGASPSATVRVMAASSEDLRAAARAGQFRADLLYRLDVASVRMPPLRELPEVIGQLAARFAVELADQFRMPRPQLAPESLAELRAYHWPGNVRELRNAVERALIFHQDGPLHVRPPEEAEAGAPPAGVLMPPGLTLGEVERRYLLAALDDFRGDYATLAARLGISRKTLWEKRRRIGLTGPAGDRSEHAIRSA